MSEAHRSDKLHPSRRRRLRATVSLFSLLLGIAGCGAGDESPRGSRALVGEQDVGHGRRPIPPSAVLARLPPDGGPEWNRLVFEKIPYFLQHAANPVDWFPWGDEAFARARSEDKPIFLSIGYSTCHWCHVMEQESFEDAQVAALLNGAFVCIKVDREERPDVDTIYMNAAQAMTGGGGWPLTVFLTPDRIPFFAGTYFPKTGGFGRPGMMELLPAVADAWRTQRRDLLESAERVREMLQRPRSGAPADLDADKALTQAAQSLAGRFDATHGGFGSAPKFPLSQNLRLLLRVFDRTRDAPSLAMVRTTLDAMRRGGIWDHVGFGFHRYATDEKWLVPHFEKMLYDQALLSMAYLEAYQVTGDAQFAGTAREIFLYVQRDMTSPEGAFYSAEDADSEGEEGRFYVWTAEEIRAVLGEDSGELWSRVYGVTPAGNFREPHSGTAANVLNLERDLSTRAKELGLGEAELSGKLEKSRAKLLAARERRPRPFRDEKILADWNGLTIAALAMGSRILDDAGFAESARRAADFVLETMRDDEGRLLKRFRLGQAALDATLEDYAFFGWGLLELYESTFDSRYLEECIGLAHRMLADFQDEANGGFFLSRAGREDLLTRPKEAYDGAIPSGNSVAALLLLRLGRLTADSSLERDGERVLQAFAADLMQAPFAHCQMMLALDFLRGPSYEVVVAGRARATDTEALLRALNAAFLPRKVVVLRPPAADGDRIARLAPYVEPHGPIDGKATVYVCRNFSCRAPTTSAEEMLAALGVRGKRRDEVSRNSGAVQDTDRP